MIPSDFIDELLSKVDIVDIIDEQVPLKKGGANYMACCPFHKEKTPSFSVSPTKQFYHCFSCGAHGSAIGFVMEHQGLSFPEAVQFLADRVGMTVPKVRGQEDNPEIRAERKKKQQTLEETKKLAMEHYAFCYDIVDQCYGTLEKLADALYKNIQWYFWWDKKIKF